MKNIICVYIKKYTQKYSTCIPKSGILKNSQLHHNAELMKRIKSIGLKLRECLS